MRVAVAGELVALGGDLPDEIGVPLGGHAEDEERRLRAELVEQAEDRGALALERVAARSQSSRPSARWTSWCQSSKSKLSRSLAIASN